MLKNNLKKNKFYYMLETPKDLSTRPKILVKTLKYFIMENQQKTKSCKINLNTLK